VVEGVYSMDGDIAPIPEFVALKKNYGAFLMVDEAHSSCVIGRNGGGVDDYFDLLPPILTQNGHAVQGSWHMRRLHRRSAELIDYLRYSLPASCFRWASARRWPPPRWKRCAS
jgi:hypothetical protein